MSVFIFAKDSVREFSHILSLRRTAPYVMAPASAATFPPAMQVPRRTPRSLSLGSLSRMQTLTLIGIFMVSVAYAADPNPRELIAAATKRPWPGESYPALPALSSTMQGQVGSEIAASPAVRAAFNQLNSARSNHDWFAGIEALEQQKAVWSLQAALCHPHEDVQIQAICALGRLKDPSAVPFLLIYADFMAVFESGSENATIHGMIHESLAQTLSAITGVSVTLEGQDPDGLKRAIRRWTQWNLDHTK